MSAMYTCANLASMKSWDSGPSHCSACGITFRTLKDFDNHRTGASSNRRCLDPRDAGMVPDVQDLHIVWSSPRKPKT